MTPESERKKNYRNNSKKQIMGLIKDSAGTFKALVLEGPTFQNAPEKSDHRAQKSNRWCKDITLNRLDVIIVQPTGIMSLTKTNFAICTTFSLLIKAIFNGMTVTLLS